MLASKVCVSLPLNQEDAELFFVVQRTAVLYTCMVLDLRLALHTGIGTSIVYGARARALESPPAYLARGSIFFRR